jgi:hypothetical protein
MCGTNQRPLILLQVGEPSLQLLLRLATRSLQVLDNVAYMAHASYMRLLLLI